VNFQIKEFFAKGLKSLFSRMNRGILLDISVFVLSIFLVPLLADNFIKLTRAPAEDLWAKLTVAFFYTGLLFLSPLGAILKKYQFWERIQEQDKEKQVVRNIRLFIFSPWFCFIWLLVIGAFAAVSWSEILSPDVFMGSSTIIMLAIFFGWMIYCFVGAVVISDFYDVGYGKAFWQLHIKGSDYDLSGFSIYEILYSIERPFFDRIRNFLETPLAAALGDLCIFLNMIAFQIFWVYLFTDLHGEGVKTGEDVFNSSALYLLMLCLFYFPPRNFYLAENIHRPIDWLTILLANLPSFLYFFFRVRIL